MTYLDDFPGVLVDLRPVTGDELRKNSVEVVTLQKNEGSKQTFL